MIELGLVYIFLRVRYGLRLMRLSYDQFDSFILRQEKRWGSWRWSLLVAIGLLLAACLYVRPASRCAYLGKYYAMMADNPLGIYADNVFPHRILTPAVSYVLGLRGHWIIVTNIMIAGFFILVVYRYYRRKAPQPGDAALAAAIFALSLPVLTTLYYGGYSDIATYLLIFLTWQNRSRPFLFYLFFMLGLFNHDSVAFMIPWLLFLVHQEPGRRHHWILDGLVGFGLSLGLYLLFRQWIFLGREGALQASNYIAPLLDDPLIWFRRAYPYIGLGWFTVFKSLWLVPLFAGVQMWRRGRRDLVVSMLLVAFCASAQLLLAWDVSRILSLSFPIMLIALSYLFCNEVGRVRQWLPWLIALNLTIPQMQAINGTVQVMHSLLAYAVEYLLRS